MKIWFLEPAEDSVYFSWCSTYDTLRSLVVRAESEDAARLIASKYGGRECETGNPWLDPKHSTCVELTADGEPGVIVRDYEEA